jgi:hypothetical protein
MADHEPMTDVACGEPELSDELRDALTLLRDRSDDDTFRTLIDDVLAGRCGLMDASGTAAFAEAVFAPMAQEFDARCGQLTDEERECLAAQGGPEGGDPACGPCGGCAGSCAALRADPAQ